MKHKKAIKIKDPKLQKIRNNLRSILIKFALDKESRLRKELTSLWRDESGNPTPQEYYEVSLGASRRPVREMGEIKKILDRSICMCPVCGRSNRDMIFNPVTKVWFCVHCYGLNREYYKHTEDGKFYP